MVSASGRPVLLLPLIVPFVLTVPLSLRIGPLSALDESLTIAETSDVSVEELSLEDFFWNVRSERFDSVLLSRDCEKAIVGAVNTIKIINIFNRLMRLVVWVASLFNIKGSIKYRSNLSGCE